MHCLVEVHRSGRVDGHEGDTRFVDTPGTETIHRILGIGLRRSRECSWQVELRPNHSEVDSLHHHSTCGHASSMIGSGRCSSSTGPSCSSPSCSKSQLFQVSVVPVFVCPIGGFVAFGSDLQCMLGRVPIRVRPHPRQRGRTLSLRDGTVGHVEVPESIFISHIHSVTSE